MTISPAVEAVLKIGLNSSEIRSDSAELPVIEVGDFTLDMERGSLRSGSVDIALRPKSLDVLTYLVKSAGRIVSKDELLSEIWKTINVSDDSLSQCIHDVRGALNDDAHMLIKTVPRRGYMVPEQSIVFHQRVADGTTVKGLSAVDVSWLDWPRIVVHPFSCSIEAEGGGNFASGLVENIVAGLCRTKRLYVIAQIASCENTDEFCDLGRVASDQTVRYVLSGSVRQSTACLRVTPRLTQADTGAVLWTERYDAAPCELFLLQDKFAEAIIGAIVPQIHSAEVERIRRLRPVKLSAYDLYLQAIPAVRELTIKGNDRALLYCNQALELDPDFAAAAGLAAWIYCLRVPQGWQVKPPNEQRLAINFARRAVRLGTDQNDAEALSYGGYVIAFLGEELSRGLAFLELAIDISPGNAQAYAFSGWVRCYLGDSISAERDFRTALRLSPRDPNNFRTYAGLSFANLINGKLEDAVMCGTTALQLNPNYTPTHRALASALGHLGRKSEANSTMSLLLENVPGLTVTRFARQSLFKHSGKLEFILEGLRKAGLND